MIDTRLLKCFAVVAEELHFGRAAQRLFMTQPPLSQSIRKLEETLSVSLLIRSTRSVRLTPAGQELQRRIVRLDTEFDDIAHALKQIDKGAKGRLSLGLTPSASYSNLSQVLYDFRRQYPEVALDLKEMNSSEMPEALRQHRLDIALVRPTFADPDLDPVPIYAEPMVFTVRKDHPLVLKDARSIGLVQAFQHELIGYTRQTSRYFSQVLQMLATHARVEPRIVQESMTPTILALVEAGIGAAIVPSSLSRLRADTLAYLPLRGTGAIRAQLLAARLPDHNNPAVDNFLRVVRNNKLK
ncbi:MAG: LysR family transcriptional regulator [Pusillimonas sp.]